MYDAMLRVKYGIVDILHYYGHGVYNDVVKKLKKVDKLYEPCCMFYIIYRHYLETNTITMIY